MEILHEPPALDCFTPLTTHQSQTPPSFYEGPPILHHHTHDAQLVISAHDLNFTPALSDLRASTSPPIPNGHTAADTDSEQAPDIVLQGLDVCVTSERFIIFSPHANHGLAIPYPSISLHAIQRLHLPSQHPSCESEVQGLFMQLSTSDGFDDHDVDATVSLTIVPAQQAHPSAPSIPPTTTTTTTAAAAVAAEEQEGAATSSLTTTTSTSTTPEIQALFAAVTSCSNLHPDAIDQDGDVNDDAGMMYADGDGDGEIYGEGEGHSYVDGGATGLPPPMPGSGGWITAENVGEFFDGEGNWRGAGSGRLGVGAGMVRGREMGEDEGRGDGEREGEGEGQGEETKWRRTG